jgi:hypothetical protein
LRKPKALQCLLPSKRYWKISYWVFQDILKLVCTVFFYFPNHFVFNVESFAISLATIRDTDLFFASLPNSCKLFKLLIHVFSEIFIGSYNGHCSLANAVMLDQYRLWLVLEIIWFIIGGWIWIADCNTCSVTRNVQ